MMEQETRTSVPARPIAALDQHPGATQIGSPDIDATSLADALAAIPDDVFSRPATMGLPDAGLAHPHPLALDVLETGECFAIHASVPGIDPAALDIMVFGESVRIAGVSVEAAVDGAEARWLLRERPVGRFDRSVTLPAPIVPQTASANVQDGVLVVTLPKARRGTLTRIPVRSLPAADLSEPTVIDA